MMPRKDAGIWAPGSKRPFPLQISPRTIVRIICGIALLIILALIIFFAISSFHRHDTTTLFTVCGSNTIGGDAMPAIALAYETKLGVRSVTLTRPDKTTAVVAGELHGGVVQIVISAPGTLKGFELFRRNSCDIAMASKKVKASEKRLFGERDMTSPDNEHAIASDGINVIANPGVPVSSLTVAQLRDVFSGRLTNWNQLDVPKLPNLPIKIRVRDEKSGTQQLFMEKLFGDPPPNDILPKNAKPFGDSIELADSVATTEGAIGIVGLPYADPKRVRVIAVSDGTSAPLLPEKRVIATGDYYFARDLYLYTREHPSNPRVKEFVTFASFEGSEIMENNGFVGLDVREETVDPMPTGEYGKFVKGARRLSLSFRYRTGESDLRADYSLDSKSLDSVKRLRKFFSGRQDANYEVLFAGFTDAQGSSHEELSTSRAENLALQFQDLADVSFQGFGTDYPIEKDDPKHGNETNRRAEVWVRRR